LEPWFPNSKSSANPIGEVWHEVPADLPLLVKFLFTNEPLSVQVHPGDEYAAKHHGSPGKTEMWHVLAAKPGARIAAGFRDAPSKEQVRAAALAETADEIERFPRVFDIDMSRCMYCGLCEEACPEEAIVMSQNVEIAAFSRQGTLWHKHDLLVPVDKLTDTRLHHVRCSYER